MNIFFAVFSLLSIVHAKSFSNRKYEPVRVKCTAGNLLAKPGTGYRGADLQKFEIPASIVTELKLGDYSEEGHQTTSTDKMLQFNYDIPTESEYLKLKNYGVNFFISTYKSFLEWKTAYKNMGENHPDSNLDYVFWAGLNSGSKSEDRSVDIQVLFGVNEFAITIPFAYVSASLGKFTISAKNFGKPFVVDGPVPISVSCNYDPLLKKAKKQKHRS